LIKIVTKPRKFLGLAYKFGQEIGKSKDKPKSQNL
jgi:hypothetical protein